MLLLSEDGPGRLEFLKQRLEREGFEVAMTNVPAFAAPEILSRNVELVVLRHDFGGSRNLTSATEICRRYPGIPVIVLGVRTEPKDRIAALDAGAVDVMSEPHEFRELVARIQAQLRQAKLRNT